MTRSRRSLALAALALAAAPIAACGLLFDADALDRGSGGVVDANAEGQAPDDGGHGEGGDGGGGGSISACASTRGPPMVLADGECIDATEVTVGQYAVYLDSVGTTPLPLPAPCGWVTSLVPDHFEAQKTNPNRPVVWVNYCHALHFCRWANKRLCGSVGGGAATFGDAGMNPEKNQWLRACTRRGTQAYSYGTEVSIGACKNTTILEVGQRSACDGPYPGLSDMLGNAGEWIDSCVEDALTRERDGCTALGYERVRDEASCYDLTEISRYQVSDDLGFRCCGP
jgi:formylglycine-generating enzyme